MFIISKTTGPLVLTHVRLGDVTCTRLTRRGSKARPSFHKEQEVTVT